MKLHKFIFVLVLSMLLCMLMEHVESYPAIDSIRSDIIVTKWPEAKGQVEENQPGWMRQQLLKFGKVASKVGNAMGQHASKITSALDKVCEIVKTVIPLLAAVCHVGQFKFCVATNEAPGQLSDALNPTSLNLDDLDKK